MEAIKDIDQHTLCTADPFRGVIERIVRKEKMTIYLPIGGEISFARENSFTVIRREEYSLLRVFRYHQDGTS